MYDMIVTHGFYYSVCLRPETRTRVLRQPSTHQSVVTAGYIDSSAGYALEAPEDAAVKWVLACDVAVRSAANQ